MARLPEKNVLSGSKTPKTTTGEMKDALGKLRDYLNELLGDDSTDKEAARQALGIDLTELANRIETKADQQAIETAILGKADKTELVSKAQELEEAIAKRGTPVGSIEYFAMAVPPAGYLKADGAAVGRETYPDLFDAIGTTFGAGDGVSTFNLPDLIDRFAQGSLSPGQKIEAGLPNIDGSLDDVTAANVGSITATGAFLRTRNYSSSSWQGAVSVPRENTIDFSASRSNPIYGASGTVQPPALTLLPCIKAFDAVSNSGLLDMTGLANDVTDLSVNKLDKISNGSAVKYVTETFSDGVNWYRKWSDGWVEQGGNNTETTLKRNLVFMVPMQDTSYLVMSTIKSEISGGTVTIGVNAKSTTSVVMHATYSSGSSYGTATQPFEWYAFGKGA